MPPREQALDNTRWTRLCDLVQQALEQPPDLRAAFVHEACADDPRLAASAQGMLGAHERIDRFLEPPEGTASVSMAGAIPTGVSAPDALRLPAPGTRLGRFRLLSVLASGGMGAVFVAEQESPRRCVAIKVLHTGALSASHRARFEGEAALLSRLRHPHVAQVFEAGVHEGGGLPLPWFALELVEDARPITTFAQERGLDLRARVSLFVPICDALQCAHESGIVHRDLKPANLLVDGKGVPRVIDFGVARALEQDPRATALRTAAGQLIGTLPYMSPEQLSGPGDAIDARSDVYALGVVLYELLTGELPYDLGAGSLAEVTRAVRELPPRRPSSRRPALRGDLETVLLAALDKDPSRRMVSAAALASDLRLWLAGRPVAARPASAVHQLALFTRRHRVLVAATALVVCVSLLAAAFGLDRATRARQAEARAQGLFNTLLDRSLEATFDFSARVGDLPGGTSLSREMVDGALADLATLREQALGDGHLAARLGMARLRLGDVLGNPSGPNLGDGDGARVQYEAALAEGLALSAHSADSPEALRLVAMAHRRLGDHDFFAGRAGDAADRLRTSLAEFEALAAKLPQRGDTRLDVAFAHDKLVAPLGRLQDYDGAERHARLALEGFAAVAADGTISQADAQFRCANVRLNLAGLRFVAGRHDEAMEEYRAAAAELEPLVAAAPQDVPRRDKLAWARMWIGTTLQALGRDEEALPELEASLGEYRELVRLDPENVNPPVRVAHLAHALARVERAAGRPDAARAWCEQALASLLPLEVAGRLPGALAALPDRLREELAELPEAESRDG